MKYVEILGGIQTLISNEENEIMNRIQENGYLLRKKLNERQVEHCNNLVKRGVLVRRLNKDGFIYFKEVNDGLI